MRIIIIVALCLALAPAAHARDLTQAEQRVIADAVRKQLKYPEGALFKWPPLSGDTAHEYCGWVNAKNSRGSYDGYVPYGAVLFWRDGKLDEPAVLGIAGGEFANLSLQTCTKSVPP